MTEERAPYDAGGPWRQDLPLEIETTVLAPDVVRIEFREQIILLREDALVIRLDAHGRVEEAYCQLAGRTVPLPALRLQVKS